ncbi:hypothetical protein CTAYLR_008835 [Chrysophaeum taylorii]|uniref:Sulfotransferase family protein n=1 Tax=Chrysophaeum taylorii TaxID=2483200 RepID=A0AAD7U712_9STRA|nr:hypothetical protein CTAYLR_008835 [Chrysophaeum taylorii]
MIFVIVGGAPSSKESKRWMRAAEVGLEKACAGFRLSAAQRNLIADGRRFCRKPLRDMWCLDMDTVRGFGHPQGMVYVGRNAKFVYLPIPKVATTTGRQWSRAAFREDSGKPGNYLIPEAKKPVADRMEGASLFRLLPSTQGVAFAFVRDPLNRFASAWREIEAYGKSRREWGKYVLGAQGFANATEHRMAKCVRELACIRDWNEHLTPQTFFLPDGWTGDLAPVDRLPSFLPRAARAANLSEATARKFAALEVNKREGWPRPENILAELDAADRVDRPRVPTRFLWCWIYARDYAAFSFFSPPP